MDFKRNQLGVTNFYGSLKLLFTSDMGFAPKNLSESTMKKLKKEGTFILDFNNNKWALIQTQNNFLKLYIK